METSGLSQIFSREIGTNQPSNFLSSELMSRMYLYKQWTPPRVGRDHLLTNLQFDSTGDRLFCSFGESTIQLLDWEAGTVRDTYDSGLGFIRDFEIMPSTNDRQLVVCNHNGNVIHGMLGDGGMQTRHLGGHEGVASKLAVDPFSPSLCYSCGLDANVLHYDLRADGFRTLVSCTEQVQVIADIIGTGRIDIREWPNISVNPGNTNYFCVGLFDEVARVFDIRKCMNDSHDIHHERRLCVGKYSPPVPLYTHTRLPGEFDFRSISSLSYSQSGELLVSYGGDYVGEERICLFPNARGFGPMVTPAWDAVVPPDVLHGYEPPIEPWVENVLESLDPLVYFGHRYTHGTRAASFLGPKDDYIMCGSTCGFIYIWDKKSTDLVQQIAGDRQNVYLVEAHPRDYVFASFGYDNIVNVWAPTPVDEDKDKGKSKGKGKALRLPDNSASIREWKQTEEAREAKIEKLRLRGVRLDEVF